MYVIGGVRGNCPIFRFWEKSVIGLKTLRKAKCFLSSRGFSCLLGLASRLQRGCFEDETRSGQLIAYVRNRMFGC